MKSLCCAGYLVNLRSGYGTVLNTLNGVNALWLISRSMGTPHESSLSHTDITVLHSCFFVFDGWYRCESSLLPDSLYVDHNLERDRAHCSLRLSLKTKGKSK